MPALSSSARYNSSGVGGADGTVVATGVLVGLTSDALEAASGLPVSLAEHAHAADTTMPINAPPTMVPRTLVYTYRSLRKRGLELLAGLAIAVRRTRRRENGA